MSDIQVTTEFLVDASKAIVGVRGYTAQMVREMAKLRATKWEIDLTPRMPDSAKIDRLIRGIESGTRRLVIGSMIAAPDLTDINKTIAELSSRKVKVGVEFVPQGGTHQPLSQTAPRTFATTPASPQTPPAGLPMPAGGKSARLSATAPNRLDELVHYITIGKTEATGHSKDLLEAAKRARNAQGLQNVGQIGAFVRDYDAIRETGPEREAKLRELSERHTYKPQSQAGGVKRVGLNPDSLMARTAIAKVTSLTGKAVPAEAINNATERLPTVVDSLRTRIAELQTTLRTPVSGGSSVSQGASGFASPSRAAAAESMLSQVSPRAASVASTAKFAGISLGTAARFGPAAAGLAVIAGEGYETFKYANAMNQAQYTGRIRGRAAQLGAETQAAEGSLNYVDTIGGSVGRFFSDDYRTRRETRRDNAIQRQADYGARDELLGVRVNTRAMGFQTAAVGAGGYTSAVLAANANNQQASSELAIQTLGINESGLSPRMKQMMLNARQGEYQAKLLNSGALKEMAAGDTDAQTLALQYAARGEDRNADVAIRDRGFAKRTEAADSAYGSGRITADERARELRLIENERAIDDARYRRSRETSDSLSGADADATRREAGVIRKRSGRDYGRQDEINDATAAVDERLNRRRVEVGGITNTDERARAEQQLGAEEVLAVEQKNALIREINKRYAAEDADLIDDTNADRLRAQGRAYEAEIGLIKAFWGRRISLEKDAGQRQLMEQRRDAQLGAVSYQSQQQSNEGIRDARMKESRLNNREYEEARKQLLERAQKAGEEAGSSGAKLFDPKTGKWADPATLNDDDRAKLEDISRNFYADQATLDRARRRTLGRDESDVRQAKLRSEGKAGAADVEGMQQQYREEMEENKGDTPREESTREKWKYRLDEYIRGQSQSEMFGSAADYANASLMKTLNGNASGYSAAVGWREELEGANKPSAQAEEFGNAVMGPRAEAKGSQTMDKFDRLIDKFGRVVDDLGNVETIGV